jgi:hypothetical protein
LIAACAPQCWTCRGGATRARCARARRTLFRTPVPRRRGRAAVAFRSNRAAPGI